MTLYQLYGRFCQSGGHCESVNYQDTDYSNLEKLRDSAFRSYAGWIVDVYPTITEIIEPAPTPAPELPPETFEVGSPTNPYVFVISSNSSAVIDIIEKAISWVYPKIDDILDKTGYYSIYTGTIRNGNELNIYVYKKGSEPISLTFLLVVGIIALAVAFVVYQLRFSIRAYMDGKVLIEREDTAPP